MATRVIDDTKLQNIAVAIQAKDNGGQMTVDEMAGRIDDIIVAPVPVQNPALILWDWEGTKLAEYSREDVLALTELPAPNTLTPYAGIDHEWLVFQEWNWNLTDIKDWVQKRQHGALDVGAIYATIDGETHNTWPSSRLINSGKISEYKTSNTNITYGMLQNNSSLRSISIPYGSVDAYNYAFSFNSALKHFNVPSSITTLRTGAFQNDYALEHIVLPNTAISAWGEAFHGCVNLKNINIDHWRSVGQQVFQGCYNLTQIYLSQTILSIDDSAFKKCSSLCDVLMEAKPTLANINAFEGLPSNYYIYVPSEDLSWFETETNWSTIYTQGHIVAIEDHIEYLESIGFDVEAYKEAA